MHTRLVHFLEDRVADGEIDPDRLATADADAKKAYVALQERWMTTPLADGRVPMTVLLDEQDEQLIADWAAADAEALETLGELLDAAGPGRRPCRSSPPSAPGCGRTSRAPAGRARCSIAFSGLSAPALPADDKEMWLTLAASVASPQGDPLSAEDQQFARAMEWASEGDSEDDSGPDEQPDELSAAMAAVCALDHFDWLAVMSALVTGGPGTPASAADLARYVREYDPATAQADDDLDYDDFPDDDDFDDLSIEGLFLHVTAMWSVLGAIDEDDRLTALGWWGLPEAMRRAWSE